MIKCDMCGCEREEGGVPGIVLECPLCKYEKQLKYAGFRGKIRKFRDWLAIKRLLRAILKWLDDYFSSKKKEKGGND